MFGYVRPNKGELLVREFSRFRSVYCGICKEIGRSYGQIPRVALTYDITMLGVLMISLSKDSPKEKMERCILNPIQKRPMLADHEILHYCAALSVLLANGKFLDEIQDGSPIIGNLGRIVLKKATRKASKEYPAESKSINDGLKRLRSIEISNKTDNVDMNEVPSLHEAAASQFGEILQTVFKEAFSLYFSEDPHKEHLVKGIARMGFHFGKWIFIIDAIDDYDQDIKTKNWNPFKEISKDKARETAQEMLLESEKEMDRIAALLPYNRDAGIISNIIQEGLPLIRQKIFLNQKLGRL